MLKSGHYTEGSVVSNLRVLCVGIRPEQMPLAVKRQLQIVFGGDEDVVFQYALPPSAELVATPDVVAVYSRERPIPRIILETGPLPCVLAGTDDTLIRLLEVYAKTVLSDRIVGRLHVPGIMGVRISAEGVPPGQAMERWLAEAERLGVVVAEDDMTELLAEGFGVVTFEGERYVIDCLQEICARELREGEWRVCSVRNEPLS